GAEWRDIVRAELRDQWNEIIEETVCRTNGRSSITVHIPCETKPWRNAAPLHVLDRVLTDARVTIVENARRRVRVLLRLDALRQLRQIEEVRRAVCELHREKWLPADAIGHCHLPGSFPRVGRIE